MSEQQRGPAIYLDECWTMHLNKMDSVSFSATYVHEDGTHFGARFQGTGDTPSQGVRMAAEYLFRRVKALFQEGAANG